MANYNNSNSNRILKEESNLPLKLDNNDDNDTKQTNWNRDDVVTLQL